LAKNLLQSVLRKWHARLPGITATTDALVAGARRAAAALEAGDLAGLGAALDAYWAQKKTMADGAEPAFIRDMIAALRPRVHGAALCGAGGGGFLCLITKQPNDVDAIRRVLEAHADLGDVSLHVATVDREGLTLARS
jgi:fucokinase